MSFPKDFTLPAIVNWSAQRYYTSPVGGFPGEAQPFTALAIAAPPRSPTNQHIVGNFSTILGNTFGWRLYYSNAWFADIGDGAAGVQLNGSSFGGSSSKWGMAVLTVQLQTASLFVNGSLVASANTAQPAFLPNPTGVCSMGYDVNGAKDPASGYMGLTAFGYVPGFAFPDDIVANSVEGIYAAGGQGLFYQTPNFVSIFQTRYVNDGEHPPVNNPMVGKLVWPPSHGPGPNYTRSLNPGDNLNVQALSLPWA